MKTLFTLGSAADADLSYAKPGISRQHLQIEYLAKDKLRISDLDSTNGTYINEEEIATSYLKPGDRLRLGPVDVDVPDLFQKVHKLYLQNKTDLSEEFEELRRDFLDFQKKREKIETSGNRKATYLKIGSSLSVIAILFLLGDRLPGNLRYPLITAAGLLAAIFGLTDKERGRRREKMDLLYAEYEDKLTCPKCQHPLIRHSLAYWEMKKSCPKCKAKWIK